MFSPTARSGRSCIQALLLVALSFGGIACNGQRDSIDSETCRDCNVVLIMVDTLRADHLGTYGYHRQTSPHIDRFAARSILFEQARSQASCTFPSVNSLFTSRYPEKFLDQGTRDGEKIIGIPESIESMAQILKKSGYKTVALSGSPIVRDARSPGKFNKIGGFEAGFDVFETLECSDEACVWKYKPSAAQINARAFHHLAEMALGDAPFFLYLHYMDVHGPYAAPGENSRVFGPPYEGSRAWVIDGTPHPIGKKLKGLADGIEFDDRDVAHLLDRYDDEIYYFDAQFDRFLQELDRRGLADRTLIVLTSDHGEEFMEHGGIKHCRTLFDTGIRIPLILHVPNSPANGTRVGSASNLDVLPTLLDYAGIEVDVTALEGKSLRPAIEGAEPTERLSYASQRMLRSVSDSDFKLIFDLESDQMQLFDLKSDPDERTDLSGSAATTLARFSEELTRWMGGDESLSREARQRASRLSDETEQHLRAIGYIE